ncbi:Uncharacterised protein [Serratia fonticola]|nr:Uncharacterised protein [Serratia fonticola]
MINALVSAGGEYRVILEFIKLAELAQNAFVKHLSVCDSKSII